MCKYAHKRFHEHRAWIKKKNMHLNSFFRNSFPTKVPIKMTNEVVLWSKQGYLSIILSRYVPLVCFVAHFIYLYMTIGYIIRFTKDAFYP